MAIDTISALHRHSSTRASLCSPAGRRPLLARHPLLGFTLAGVGALAFAVLALTLRRNGRAVNWDQAACQAVHARAVRRSPLNLAVVKVIAALGREIAFLLTLGLGGLWLAQRRWRALAMLFVGVIGGNTWFVVLSQAFKRQRPVFSDPLHLVAGPGFPSGHAMTAVTLYGLLLYRLWPRLRAWPARWLGTFSVYSVTVLIGLSRLYLGDHYPLDILGGYSFGLFWGALTYTTLELI